MSTKIGAAGAMSLLSEHLGDSAQPCRQVGLQVSPDGKTLLMVDIDQRKAGTLRTVCYEITPAELIAAIRAHGAELAQSSDEAIAAVEALQRTSLLNVAGIGAAAAAALAPAAPHFAPTSAGTPVSCDVAPTPSAETAFANVPAVSA
jgi:hypothetical protein